jgi:hypothetical protein
MSTPQTPREHALRTALLEALQAAIADEYAEARAAAEFAFAAMYRDEGNDRQMVLLPSGEKVGQVTVKAAPPVVTYLAEDGLEAWAREHLGEEAFEEFVPASVLASKEVLAIIKAARPNLLGRRLRPATAKKLLAEAEKSGGWLYDAEEGSKEQVAEISPGVVTGAFSFTDGQGANRRARLMAELLDGNAELRDLAGFGPLALPAAEERRVPTDAEVAVMRDALYKDEHGFLGPEAAAAHAVLVQGGYTTPPVEAYRMIRDGGVAAGRARAWLAEAGLDPDDPARGKNTPWPLPAAEAGTDA